MAAENALKVVRQIQGLAEGPATAEMRDCLGQVVSALLFFLDHPDSRVRLSAARTLLKLSEGYKEEVRQLDLGRATAALARCEAAAGLVGEGCEEADRHEMCVLLTKLLGLPEPATPSSKPAGTAAPQTAPAAALAAEAGAKGNGALLSCEEGRGEVVLKVGANAAMKSKAAILEKVVSLAGVVSVTFEGEYVVVNTRTRALAADASFLADVLVVVKEQGLQGVQLVNASGARYPRGDPPAASTGGGEDEDPTSGAEPAYLDDQDDGSPASGGHLAGAGLGGASYSFFAQTNWMTGRQIQEFGDDPTIAARLAEAKRREEEKRHEQQSRLGRLSAWFTGGKG